MPLPLYEYHTPIGPPRGRQLVNMGSLPRILEIEAEGREIWINSSGEIDWRGDRPEERNLEDNEELRWFDAVSRTTVTSQLTRGGGTPAVISVAAAQRPGPMADFSLYRGSEEFTVDRSGNIDWLDGGRPPSAHRLENAILYNGAGDRLGTVVWDDDGMDPDTTTAAGNTDWYEGYRAENQPIHIDTSGNIVWLHGRPPSDTRVTGAQLRIGPALNSNFRLITWADAGDTVANPPAGSSDHALVKQFSVSVTLNQGDTTIEFGSEITDELKVGDIIRFGGTAPDLPSYTIDSIVDGDTIEATTAPANLAIYHSFYLFRAGQRSEGYRVMFPGRKYSAYEIRFPGLRLTEWELWGVGSFYGDGGRPTEPREFFMEIVDAGSGTKTAVIEDAYGYTHSWVTDDAEIFEAAGLPCLVRAVHGHATTIVSFYAIYL